MCIVHVSGLCMAHDMLSSNAMRAAAQGEEQKGLLEK
jgi:hypothetical protein